jgi:cytochrome c-type biogenesis protein CcmH
MKSLAFIRALKDQMSNKQRVSSSGLTGVVAWLKKLPSHLKYLAKFIENLTKLHSLVTLGGPQDKRFTGPFIVLASIPGVHKALKTLAFWIAGMVAGKENNPVNCFPCGPPAMTKRVVFARFFTDKFQSYQDFVGKIEPCNNAGQAGQQWNKSGDDKGRLAYNVTKQFRQVVFYFCMLTFGVALSFSAMAYEPDEVLPDPVLEERARALSAELRCMVCQNQSLNDSDAPLAKDLRLLVRQRLQAGDSDSQVKDFLVARYGEFILLKPAFSAHTWVLWLGPLIVTLLAMGLGWATLRRHRRQKTIAALSQDEENRIKALLDSRK